jgi:hypothetical protein
VKNGGGIPFRRTQVDLIYPGDGRQTGFDKVSDLITFANERNLFEKSGTHFLIKGDKVANGLEAMKRYLKNNEGAFQTVSKAVELLIKKEQEAPAASV